MGYSQVDQYCLLFVVGGGPPKTGREMQLSLRMLNDVVGGGWVEIFKDVGVWGKRCQYPVRRSPKCALGFPGGASDKELS